MYGSMIVFLVLSVTANFTPPMRRACLLSLAWYYFKAGYFLCQFMFIAGALLAEISLVLNTHTTIEGVANAGNGTYTGGTGTYGGGGWSVFRWLREYWPFATALGAWLLASVPPENQTYAPFSREIYFFFEDHITTEWGTPSPLIPFPVPFPVVPCF